MRRQIVERGLCHGAERSTGVKGSKLQVARVGVGFGLLLQATIGALAAEVDFSHDVVPILRKHCVECHGGDKAKGGFSINTRESFLDDDMAAPGRPDQSPFLELIKSGDPDDQMPPEKKDRLSAEEVKTLEAWVRRGMKWEAAFSFAPRVYEPPLKPRRPELPPAVAGRTNPIDRLLDAWLAQRKLPRPKPIDDARFLRRASLDLVGLLPTTEELEAFLADRSPDKRAKAVRRLLADDIGYADHWLAFWNDLLRNDYTGTGFITGGRKQISGWLYESLVANKPFDLFVRELIAPPTPASRGYIDGIKWRGEVSAGQTVEIQFAQSVSQSFLGINLKCASCHDSFIDRWKLDEAYGMAAIYSTRSLDIHRCDKPVGRTAQAAWLFPEIGSVDPQASQPERLKQLAGLMTHPKNGRTTRTIVNRLWGQLMGHGLVHPLDAMQTEPWNTDALDFLAVYLVDQKHDLKKVLELITTSEAYQSECEIAGDEAETGDYAWRGPRARRLTAEQFVDALWQITGTAPVSFDAPIIRGRVEDGAVEGLKLQAHWIWGDSAANRKVPAAGEEILLRKVLKLEDEVARGGATITCDNEFVLFVNGREVVRGTDWTKPLAVALHDRLKKGNNQIVVRAKNAGSGPNPAGLFFEARLKLRNGKELSVASGADWQWNATLPKSREGRLGAVGGKWAPATVVPTIGSWNEKTRGPATGLLAQISLGRMPMVRASLMKSDFLMRSLGRPMRDQIVTSRPSELSALEAIDLHNNEVFADALARGGKDIAAREWRGTEDLARSLFRQALAREPEPAESRAIREAMGDKPTAQGVEDLLWAILLKPEFLLVR